VRVLELLECQLEVVTAVLHRDDQTVSRRHWVAIWQDIDRASNSRVRGGCQLAKLAICSHGVFIPTLDLTASSNSLCIFTMSASNA
jgi:hypothetical protein